MIALLLTAATCVLPSTPVLATATVVRPAAGETVRAALTPGAVHLGAHIATRCDDLPAPHPVAIAAWRGRLAVGFRDGGVWTWDGTQFVALAGLPNTPVRALAATGDTLWIATSDGLYEATDTIRKSTVLGTRTVTALAADGDTLLAGADPRGLWKIHGGKADLVDKRAVVGCFAGSKPHADCTPAAPDRPEHVTAFAVHHDHLIAGTFADGVWEQSGDSWARVPGAPRFVDQLLVDGDALYVASATGLFRRTAGAFEHVDLGLASTHVNDLVKSGDTLWLATSRGLAAWDGHTVRILDTGSARVVYTVAVASDGAVWAGTIAGAIRFGSDGIIRYDRARGSLPADWVTALVPDADGSVLAGTYDSGVARLFPDGHGAPLAGLTGGLWINPHGIVRMDDTVAALTLGGGLVRADGQAIPRLPDDDVTAAVRMGDTLWIGTRGGIARTMVGSDRVRRHRQARPRRGRRSLSQREADGAPADQGSRAGAPARDDERGRRAGYLAARRARRSRR